MDLTQKQRKNFLSKIDVSNPSGCWVWTGSKVGIGYGKVNLCDKDYRAHRISYLMYLGPIPDGKLVCHSCDNPSCVRPDHLFIGSAKENTQDMLSKKRNNNGWAKRTHCKSGHEFNLKNTRYTKKQRICRVCQRNRYNEWYYGPTNHERLSKYQQTTLDS